jgi:muramoyltetrapeptide carboxypeptidase LdcA involved in peptidoglycan recycling
MKIHGMHPKIIIGYSDITALLVAINRLSNLVTFHGPVASSTFDPFTVDYFNKTLGNLIGLSKLLQFICIQSGRVPGKLIIHSANAYYDCNNNTLNNIII